MSLTIFESTSKYASVTNQVVLNELGAYWDTGHWKNSSGDSVVYASGTEDVATLHVTDKISISLGSGTDAGKLVLSHTNGASVVLSSSITSAFRIIKTETALVLDVVGSSMTFEAAIGRTIDSSGTESYGVFWKSATTASTTAYVFTDKASTSASNANYTHTTSIKTSSSITQLLPICSRTCDESFRDDVRMVYMCPENTAGRSILKGTTYYLTHYSTSGILAVKYTD